MTEAVEATVEWWANQLRNPPKLDNGDAVATAVAAVMLADCRNQPTDGQIRVFSDSLREIIGENMRTQSPFFIRVDYDPDLTLHAALLAAGIDNSTGLLPWKTWTATSVDEVSVKSGYSAKPETIWRQGE
jgi:hypothetical protein